jgi:hypothetical protein
MTYVLQVTGSSDWTDKETVYRALDEELEIHASSWLAAHNIHDPGFDESSEAAFHQAMLKDFALRHGVARGVDTIANDWARERGVTVERFPAQWTDPVTRQYNPSAGPIRNREMANKDPRADRCVAFWSGKHRRNRDGKLVSGTLDMISVMLGIGVEVRVVPPRAGGDRPDQ